MPASAKSYGPHCLRQHVHFFEIHQSIETSFISFMSERHVL